jgi:hypothetical protein
MLTVLVVLSVNAISLRPADAVPPSIPGNPGVPGLEAQIDALNAQLAMLQDQLERFIIFLIRTAVTGDGSLFNGSLFMVPGSFPLYPYGGEVAVCSVDGVSGNQSLSTTLWAADNPEDLKLFLDPLDTEFETYGLTGAISIDVVDRNLLRPAPIPKDALVALCGDPFFGNRVPVPTLP